MIADTIKRFFETASEKEKRQFTVRHNWFMNKQMRTKANAARRQELGVKDEENIPLSSLRSSRS